MQCVYLYEYVFTQPLHHYIAQSVGAVEYTDCTSAEG